MVFLFNSNPVNSNTVLIQFSGKNARQFYWILKTQKFDPEIFNLTQLRLGRIDVNYIRDIPPSQTISESDLLLFFEKSRDKFQTRYPSSEPQIIGTTLGLRTRTGDYFLRVYLQKDHSLKFELEIKKYKAKQLTSALIQNSFTEFEDSICRSFYWYLKTLLVLDMVYTNWLLMALRNTHKPINCLVSNYLKTGLSSESSNAQKLTFYRTIQLLSFIRTCHFKKEILNGESYYTVSFNLADFAKQIDLDPLTTYRRRQLIQFLNDLQGFPQIS